VKELPLELEDMFKLMLSKFDKRHREQGAFIMRVCHALDSTTHESTIQEFKGGHPKSLGLAILAHVGGGQDDVSHHRRLSKAEKRERCEGFARWLTSRCGGLLELQQYDWGGQYSCFCSDEKTPDSHDILVDSSVQWMHRTVFEFLKGSNVWELECLLLDNARPSMAATLSLYGLYLTIQAPRNLFVGCVWSNRLVYSGMMGAQADIEDSTRRAHSLWKMSPALEAVYRAESTESGSFAFLKVILSSHQNLGEGLTHATLLLAAELGAVNYLKACFEDSGGVHWHNFNASCNCLSILSHAICLPLLAELAVGQSLDSLPMRRPGERCRICRPAR
jgi:hypothetical protein